MAIVHGYCSLDDLKAWLGISDPNDDTNLEGCITAASRSIERFCGKGRQFWSSPPASKLFTATSSALVMVDDFYTTADLAVVSDMDGDGEYETTWTLDTDFVIEPANDSLYFRLRARPLRWFPRCADAVQVTARWGWASVPDEVELACKIKAAQLFQRRQSPAGVQGNDQFGFVRVSRYEDPNVVDLLSKFQRGDTAPAFGLA